MPETLVIVNTSPLLYLYQVNCLELLQQLYGTITVPPAVPQELETGKRQGVDVPEVNSIEWIQIRPVASATIIPAVIDLGQGEAEVIALGLENPGSLLILDDSLARRIADLYRLKDRAIALFPHPSNKRSLSSASLKTSDGISLSPPIVDKTRRKRQ